MTGQCWRERTKRKPCEKASCCYNASGQACFEYWKYANSEKWKKMLADELKKRSEVSLLNTTKE